jgi:hypothetical protein
VVFHDAIDKQVKLHLPILLGAISGESISRKYKLPNVREVSKILKQEKYVLGNDLCKVDGKVARRWVIDLTHTDLPEILKNMFDEEPQNKENQNDFNDL